MIPDYVFDPNYNLMPLDRLATFIEEEKHLPRIPSAKEMKDGVNMSRLQMQLREKVEELTLYILAQEEAILELQSRLEALEKRRKLPLQVDSSESEFSTQKPLLIVFLRY
ncbi:hypothetical protein N9903_00165 [bacterium]|nr:hypothetical protein [bacterium]